MKRLILLAFLFISITAMAQRKIGLIVAIGDYPNGGQWKDLSSINDIKYIRAALMQNGFSSQDIDTLINQNATKAGILRALDKLIAKARRGDVVVFHFSGHGQQIFDDNNDELDGYDEALIPWDAAAMYDPVTYRGENHLRDDELGEKLNAIRKKIGSTGSLLVLIDACHSGTGTRNFNEFVARGNPVPFNKPGYKPNINTTLASNSGLFFGDDVGNMIVISASSPEQVNYETKDADNAGVGSLSYMFAKAISELPPGSTYQLLFEKIRAQIQARIPQQRPMIEGNASQVVFGGNFIPQQSYIGINKWVSDTTMMINVGFLSSVSKGTRFTLYALNDKDETMPLAEGEITIAGTFQSLGSINRKIPRGEAYKVKIDETGFGDFTATLLFKSANEKAQNELSLINQMQRYIAPYQFLSVGDNPDYVVEVSAPEKGSHRISLVDKADSTRWNVTVKSGDTLSAPALKEMLDNLKRSMRINYLRNMPDGGAMVQKVTVEIIPFVPSEGTDISLRPGDQFSIRIVNKNSFPVYFNLIDLMPDNDVKVLLPHSESMPEECVVQANSEFVISEVEVDNPTPVGREFMKFIFSKTPMDLRPVLARSATRGPASGTGIEDVLNDMFKDGEDMMSTRANIPSRVKVEEIGVITRSIDIKQ